MNQNEIHISVMPNEVLEHLRPLEGALIVDCTTGLGGHAQLIAQKIGPDGRLICVDKDQDSLNLAKERLKEYPWCRDFVQDDFRNFDKILINLGIKSIDGILFDLGLSSFQLADQERGFSFNTDGPLDMRMDKNSHISAYDIVNSLSEKELSLILKNFGEERWHNRIAKSLVHQRHKHPIESTRELSETILRAVPSHGKRQRIHPATRTFQALRIAVNRELESLEKVLSVCVDYLKSGGRICVISFHSLEDRIVKQKFRSLAQSGQIKLIVKKPLCPSDEEVRENSRSRSAKLRVVEKV